MLREAKILHTSQPARKWSPKEVRGCTRSEILHTDCAQSCGVEKMRWGFEGLLRVPRVTISPSHTLPGSQQVARGDNGETFSGVAHRDQDYEIVPVQDLKTVFLSALLVDD